MREFVHQVHCSTSANLTVGEGVILIFLGLLAWFNRRDKKWFPTTYSVFLIFYITLLRRAPGYNENIRLHLKLWPNAGVWAGNLLNLMHICSVRLDRSEMENERKENSRCGFSALGVL